MRVAKLNEERVRIAREVTLPIVTEIEPISNQMPISPSTAWKSKPPQAAREMTGSNGKPWQSAEGPFSISGGARQGPR